MAITLTIFVVLVCVICTESYGRLVGGRSEIANVKTNEEVQELGRFSVEEYNRSLRLWRKTAEAEEELEFMEVVEAEEQVVSGIKYYLKILATQSGGSRMFESVVVVKPWLRYKQLLHFAPSSQFSSHDGRGDVLLADILAIEHGLVELAWQHGYKKVICESDSLSAFQTTACISIMHVLAITLSRIKELLQRNWVLKVDHVSREVNSWADFFAKHGMKSCSGWMLWEEPPVGMGSFLPSDEMGLSFLS